MVGKSNACAWHVDNMHGDWYEGAYIDGQNYKFNPILHLRRGSYRIEYVKGWPVFVQLTGAD